MQLVWWMDRPNGPAIHTYGVDVYEGKVVVRQHLQRGGPPPSTDTECDDIIRSLDRTAGDRPDDVAVSEVWFDRTWREPMAIFTLNQGAVVVRCELAAEALSP